MNKLKASLFLPLLVLLVSCSRQETFQMVHQVTGGIETNCYLVYGEKSKEAALIDVGGEIDSLLAFLHENDLLLKYFLCTHGHPDHHIGIHDICEDFPEALIVLHKLDYDDLPLMRDWMIENMSRPFLEYMLSDSQRKKIYDYDCSTFEVPDIFIEDNDVLPLGFGEIKVFHTPGHSPGSVCYYIDNKLFTGDLLFYRSAGRTDLLHGSHRDLVKSIQRLYDLFQDDTPVYPGHNQFTDIGSEKMENKEVPISSLDL